MKKVTSNKLNLNKQTISNLIDIKGGGKNKTQKNTCYADCNPTGFCPPTRIAQSVCVCGS